MPEKNLKTAFEVNKLHEIEFGKIIDATNSLITLRVQVGGIFFSSSVAVVGIALSSNKAGFLFLGALLMLFLIYSQSYIKSSMAAYYLRGLQIQSSYEQEDNDMFLGTYISLQPKLAIFIRSLLKTKDLETRNKALKNLGLRFPSMVGFWIPMIGFLIEILLGIYFLQAGWSLF